MASKFYGLNRGVQSMQPDAVTVGAATGGTDVELRVDTGKNLTREDVRIITAALLRRVLDGRDANLKL